MRALKRLRLNLPLILGLLMLLGLLALLVLPYVAHLADPDQQQLSAQVNGLTKVPPFGPGEAGHLFGSDAAGRDVLGRVIYGARATVAIALAVNLVRVLLSIPLGLLAGWRRGWLGRVVQGLATGFSSLPTLMLVVLVMGVLRMVIQSYLQWWLLYGGILVVAGVPRLAEQVRRLTEEAAVRPHVEAAVATGATGWRILRRHIFPVLRGDLLVAMAAEMAWVLMLLGQVAVFDILLGGSILIERPSGAPVMVERMAEWGQMMGNARGYLRSAPWIAIAPATALGLTVACFQLLAEGIRQRWAER